MTSVADRLRKGLDVARQSGRTPIRITMTTQDAGALALEDLDDVEYGLDGRPAAIDGVPITVIHGLQTSTITAEVIGQRGQSSDAV